MLSKKNCKGCAFDKYNYLDHFHGKEGRCPMLANIMDCKDETERLECYVSTEIDTTDNFISAEVILEQALAS